MRQRRYYHPGVNPMPRKPIETPARPIDPVQPLSRQVRRALLREAAKGNVEAARRLGIVKE